MFNGRISGKYNRSGFGSTSITGIFTQDEIFLSRLENGWPKPPRGLEILVVGAGGGGGGTVNNNAGASGGGGGGVLVNSFSLKTNQVLNIVIGSGGVNATTGTGTTVFYSSGSIVLQSFGGGGAGPNQGTGKPGGSGGGGFSNISSGGLLSGIGITGQGFNGGVTSNFQTGAGGGGATAGGGNAPTTTGGAGFNLLSFNNVNENVGYGGNGGAGPAPTNNGAPAPANSGGGGGGGRSDGSSFSSSGGTGGSGRAVIRYKGSTQLATGGTVGIQTISGTVWTIHTFNSSGTFTANSDIL